MLVIPAIDLKDGRCVRLRQGSLSRMWVYDEDPAEAARRWRGAGARWLHVVDLDGAFEGRPRNGPQVQAIVGAVDIPVQLGGGLRDAAAVETALDTGVARVILGTAAVETPEMLTALCARHGDRVAVALDVREGRVVVKGWTAGAVLGPEEAAARVIGAGVRRLIYTDVSRDGMLAGPNFAGLEALLRTVTVPVIASGGVTTLEDVRRLAALVPLGLEGVIVGRALYEGTLDLAEAITVAGEV